MTPPQTTATPVAAASLALRHAPPGTIMVSERTSGPRFPNGYVPLRDDSIPPTAGAVPRVVAGPIGAQRWWDPRIRTERFSPHLVDRFVSSIAPMTLPGPPEACVGWGPGLTPAADDVLVGLLAAYHGLGVAERARALAASCVGAETTPFSRSLIDHAAEGRVVRPLLDLLAALAGRAPLGPALDGLRRFGSTSGPHLLDGVRRAFVERPPRLDPLHAPATIAGSITAVRTAPGPARALAARPAPTSARLAQATVGSAAGAPA